MRVTQRVAALLAILLSPSSICLAQPGDAYVERAIVAGTRDAGFSPYFLRWADQSGDDEQDVVIGAIYTPFSRIALAANERRKAGAQLTPDAARALASDNLFYVALRWQKDARDFDNAPLQIVAIPRGLYTVNARKGIGPVWIVAGPAAASKMGLALHWPDVGAVAAFPAALFSPDYDFMILASIVDPTTGLHRVKHGIARIARRDFPAWIW
jgi:hypothetical protein